jgi:hypothetical protein
MIVTSKFTPIIANNFNYTLSYIVYSKGGEQFVSNGWAAVVDLGHLYQISRSHSGTPHSLGLFWTSDLAGTGTST